nr:hypothetical protein Itr_chr09CG13400 [Ipomoea trifida]
MDELKFRFAFNVTTMPFRLKNNQSGSSSGPSSISNAYPQEKEQLQDQFDLFGALLAYQLLSNG